VLVVQHNPGSLEKVVDYLITISLKRARDARDACDKHVLDAVEDLHDIEVRCY
jgi:hypothetical protein